jgi:hypothetical protein
VYEFYPSSPITGFLLAGYIGTTLYYLNKFGEVNYIEEKLRIALEQKIVGCSNLFDHQKLRDVRREFKKKNVKDMLRNKWESFRICI